MGPEPLEETFALFVFRQVQEELENDRAIAGQVAFEGVDIGEAVGPEIIVDLGIGDALGFDQLRMDPDDEYVLIVRTVEDTNPPAFGYRSGISPKEVMVELLGRGMLEAVDLAALRVNARHHMLDRPVLTRGIHRLKNNENRPTICGVQPVLDCSQVGDILRQHLLGKSFALGLGEFRVAAQPVS